MIRTTILSSLILCNSAWALSEKELNDVLAAIRTVESNGNPDSVGDNGNAIGVYQIWKPYWEDARQTGNLPGVYRDCFDPVYADRVVRAYMKRYATEQREGLEVTQEDIARIHNGGPNGHKKRATLKYWAKVKKLLNK